MEQLNLNTILNRDTAEDKLKEIQNNQLNSSENKTSEQNKAIEEFQRKILSIRKQLRDEGKL